MKGWLDALATAGRGTPLAQPHQRMALTNARSLARPAMDEWGVYDPQQAGIAALVARLDARESKTAAAVPVPAMTTELPDTMPVMPTRPTLGDAQ